MNILQFSNFFLADLEPLKPVTPVPIFSFQIGGHHFVFSNVMFMLTLAVVLLSILLPLAMRSKKLEPKGAENFIELICVFLRDEMVKPVLGELTDSFVPFVWTIFFFIFSLNLLSLIPLDFIIYLWTGRENHFAGAATANIWVTGGLATITFFVTHIAGIKKQGLWRYLVNLAPKVPIPMMPIVYMLEIVTAFVRPFALAVRLFANMIAGHMVLATIMGLILVFKSYGVAIASVGATVALSFLELLIAFVQAYIFAFLSTLFISFSVTHQH